MEMNRQLSSNFIFHVLYSANSLQAVPVISFMLAQGNFKIGYDVLATGTEKVTFHAFNAWIGFILKLLVPLFT